VLIQQKTAKQTKTKSKQVHHTIHIMTDKTDSGLPSPPPSVDEGEQPVILADPDEDLPPGRLHVIRGLERLAGTKSPHPSHIRKRSLGSSNPRSRSRSPSLKDTASDSSLSLEDVDSDILTDRLGLSELDKKQQHDNAQALHQTNSSLAPVNERMSEETLDDVHAFSDARPSRGNSTVGSKGDVGNSLLETLDECEEDAEIDEKPEELKKPVMVLNLENLTIHEHDHEQEEETDDVSLEPVCGSTGPV
jgi:hypothetical protein